MKRKIYQSQMWMYLLLLPFLTACVDDLEKLPTNEISNDKQYSSIEGYKQSLISLFGDMALGDGSTVTFIRAYWAMQEYTTDEAVNTWNDDGQSLIYHQLAWSADLPALKNIYRAILLNITYCNNFLNEAGDTKIAERGFDDSDAITIRQYRAEARFLRAFNFWVLMDAFANPPFPKETELAEKYPQQIQRKDLFNFIENELKEIETLLANPKSNEWGRPDKAATWALMARMYLNAKVYTGIERYSDAIKYAKKIIAADYSLESNYQWLFLGDNHKCTNEFIFTLNYDNTKTETWGGTNFLVLGATGVPASLNGMSDSWNSFRMTQSIPNLFPALDENGSSVDKRAQFYTKGQKLEVKDMRVPSDGYSSYKFRNTDRNGNAITQKNSFKNLSDIDFPIFRLAEIYLIYAEAVLRGGTGGDVSKALNYINQLRGRAYANDPQSTQGNITQDDLNLQFIIDERARELYWEMHRRTDLIRYDLLTTDKYLWAWKGNTINGRGVDNKYNIFPIPTEDLLANPTNLKQNEGY